MAKKVSNGTKWIVIGPIIVALIGMGYFGFLFDGCNDQQNGNSNDGKDRPGAVRKK